VEKLGRKGEQLNALQALLALGAGAASAAPKVIPLITHPDSAVQLAAIRAAAELGDASAVDAIRKVHEQELKRVAGLREDWVTGKPPEGLPPGFAPLRKEGPVDGSPRAPIPTEVVDDVGERELSLLSATVEALGRLKAEGILQSLEGFRKDPAAPLRAAAYVGLAAMGPDGVALTREALLDPSRDVRIRTARCLAEQGRPGQAILGDALPRMHGDRLPILDAIDRAGPDAVLTGALIPLLDEGGPEASTAASLLGRLKAKEAVAPLLRNLEDPASIIRRPALMALGKIGDPKAAEVIARDLNHDSPDVRAAALDALAALQIQPRPDALDALKGDYYRRVRESAEAAAGGKQKPAPAPSLKSIEARTEDQ
jgi:HEAT repeat protein